MLFVHIIFVILPLLLSTLQVCTAKMNLSDEVDLEDYVSRPDKISAAEISAVCQEAGMHAVRKNRCGSVDHRRLSKLDIKYFVDLGTINELFDIVVQVCHSSQGL